MSQIANDIFFGTLAQYATDSTAGNAIRAAVADVLTQSPSFRAVAKAEAQTNLRWFSAQPEDVRVSVIALSAAVRQYRIKTEGRAEAQAAPAATRLLDLEIAAALYRLLRKKKVAVNHIVAETQMQTRAAYKAIVKSNLPLINEMREAKATRAWTTISRMLYQIVNIKIPAATLAKVHAEVFDEAKQAATAPHIMSHFENERISEEARAAFIKAGYENTDPKSTPLETLAKARVGAEGKEI